MTTELLPYQKGLIKLMKRNKMLLTDQVRKKLTAKCVTAVITEAFINGLPFDKSEVVNESANLSTYAVNVIEKMHPETLLERALESTKNNAKAHLYVSNLSTAIESIVDAATKRVVSESLHTDTPTPEIVAQTKLNDSETEKFVTASKHSGTDAVAKLVKDKMIDIIKDEKEAYETSAKLREEVRDVIKQEQEDLKFSTEDKKEDFSLNNEEKEEETFESYLNLVLDPTDAREHISVFSKMQDICMEAIMHTTERYDGEIPYHTMEKVTLESTFPYFDLSNRSLIDEVNNMLIVTEAAVAECDNMDPEEMAHKKKKIAKTAFICTICIMTMLETLKTMNLAKPELADVKSFVEDPTNIKNIAMTDLKKVEDKVIDVAADTKKSVAMGAYRAIETAQAKESLEKVRGLIESMTVADSQMEQKTRILNRINAALECMDPMVTDEIKTPDSFIERLREENATNLEHGIRLVSQKPSVNEIRISIRSDAKCTENSKAEVEIKGLDAAGACVAMYMISIHTLPNFGTTLAEVLKDIANYSDLGNKPVMMYFTDSGYSVNLKN